MKQIIMAFTRMLMLILILAQISCRKDPSTSITGEMKAWHTITITFTGPMTSEYDTVNPFTDYRLDVEFSNGDQKIIVPGYYAADGNAAETSARSGNKWRVHFSPPSEGNWNYSVTFLKGRNVAISGNTGEECYMNGEKGILSIAKTDKSAPDLRAKGRLEYTGERYLKHADGGYFLKGGANSPENLLGYNDFDGTYFAGRDQTRSANNGLHSYEPHINDWKDNDPTWKGGKGKGIIGGLNYLSSKGINSIYFITMNIMGDGEDVWPYIDRNERYRFDCSKLDQWDIVFSHAGKMGLMLHFVLEENENQCLLDLGKLDVQRKLYLRELIARFSHHLALTWNMGEEHHPFHFSGHHPGGMTYQDTKRMADYIRKNDPYDNFIVLHTHLTNEYKRRDLPEYLGFNNLNGISVQCYDVNDVHNETKYWMKESADSGHQWVVSLDETGQFWKGALPDSYDPAHDTIRTKVLWGNLMAGGAGVEWYFGYQFPHSDLNCEDWRSRDKLWDQTKIALDFFHKYLPFTEMKSADELTTDKTDYCFAKEGEIYAVYLPEGNKTQIRLPQGKYTVDWFNPRTGGELIKTDPDEISGGISSTGNPPAMDGKDWVCLIRKKQ